MRHIRAICFDLDNTLWDVWPVIRRAEQAMYEFLAERYPKVCAELTLDAMRAARARIAHEYPQMAHDFSFLRMQALREHARLAGYAEEEMAQQAFDVFLRARNNVELYEDVQPALHALRKDYRLFTASNGNADLRTIGIAHFFERCIAAREAGALKPDPLIFHKAIEATDLAPEEVIYVGDDPQMDVEGARRAGMHPVWMNRTDEPWPVALEPPPYSIATLAELVRLLEHARAPSP